MAIKTSLATSVFTQKSGINSNKLHSNSKYSNWPAYVLALLFSLLLISCSSSDKTKPTASSKKVTSTPTVTPITKAKSAEYYLAQALTSKDEQALLSLINASEQFIAQGDYNKALWLAEQTTTLMRSVEKEDIALLLSSPQSPVKDSSKDKYRLALIKSHALTELNDFTRAYSELTVAKNISQDYKHPHQKTYYQLLALNEQHRNNTLKSINAQMHSFALDENANRESVDILWQQLSRLPQWELEQLAKLNPPHIAGWLALLNYAHKFGANQAQFSRYIKQWQRTYASHPAQVVAQSLLFEEQVTIDSKENIAVLLPLSGKQKSAGIVAQQGILAAYNNDESKALHFIDTNKLDMATLATQYQTLNIDFVIGPLLKANVDKYINQADIAIPTLLLNLPKTEVLAPHLIAFSMRPEDEATQAATVLSNKQFQQPLVLSHKDAVSDRITQTFIEQWFSLTGKQPEVVHFERGQTMQREVTSSLGIARSKSRIKDLESRMKQTIKTENRNRRDIDMIYLVGSPQESTLLKPYIDVSISPFADIIPVYASSRSHGANQDASKNNDLSGLIFTEMPWLLKNPKQNSALARESKQLWPKRSDGLLRIFAMGYDSYSLIDKLPKMQKHAYIRHEGQTGSLRLRADNIITRSLLWGRYRKDRVEAFAMD